MSLANDEVFRLACQAVERMLQKYDRDFVFPFDLVWRHIEPGADIPSTSRSHQAKRLIAAGFIEKTGAMVRAASQQRAGSATPQYRFGRALVPTTQSSSASAPKRGFRTSDLLNQMQCAMDAEGYVISTAELANFYLAMMVSPLVILSGISGTGKSLLPRKFAEHTNSSFYSIPVQPQWSDDSDMFGYVPTLAPEKFIEGQTISGLREASENKQKLVIALLDEMNLAPVEHYFSDFLSVAETRRRKHGAIITDKLPIELPQAVDGKPDQHKLLRGIGLPHNLRIVGTANMDETTKSFSPKILDRAFAIEFDDPDLTVFADGASGASASLPLHELAATLVREANPITVLEARKASQALFDDVALMLAKIQDILAPSGIKFGYRTRDSILLYLHYWRDLGLEDALTSSAALDFCLLQKILPKITGTGDVLSNALDDLIAWLRNDRTGTPDENAFGFNGPFARSLQKAEQMKALLESDGVTHYWGV